jgi:hypothetical protein
MSYQYLDIQLGSGCRKEIFTPMYFFLVRKPLECGKQTSVTKGVEAWDATKALQLAPSGLDMVSLL